MPLEDQFVFAANICRCGCNRRRIGITGDNGRHACMNVEASMSPARCAELAGELVRDFSDPAKVCTH